MTAASTPTTRRSTRCSTRPSKRYGESFEDQCERTLDRRLRAVANFVVNWGINSARDLAWTNAQLLWVVRHEDLARDLFLDSLTQATELASRMLLVAVP